MKRYTITSGSFSLPDGSVRGVGEQIDLPDDVAALHAGQLAEVSTADVAPAKPTGKKD